jgi:hypothetical protein
MYYLWVNVYCTTATGCQHNCSHEIYQYQYLKYWLLYFLTIQYETTKGTSSKLEFKFFYDFYMFRNRGFILRKTIVYIGTMEHTLLPTKLLILMHVTHIVSYHNSIYNRCLDDEPSGSKMHNNNNNNNNNNNSFISIQPLGQFSRNQNPVRLPVWLWHTASWASS